MANQILIIGAGLSGLAASFAALAHNAEVTLIDRTGIGFGSNSYMSGGGFCGISPDYPVDKYIKDTLKIGRGINHKPSVKFLANNAISAFEWLETKGFTLKGSKGIYGLKVTDPSKIRGSVLMKGLVDKVKRYEKLNIITGFQVTDLIVKDNECLGIRGLDRNGKTLLIQSPAVILSTGGAGAIYKRTDNQKSALGQGYFLAAKAGLDLWDMEFVQYYALVLAEPGLPSFCLYPPYPKNTKLINHNNEDLLIKYGINDLSDAMKKKRDEMSAIIFEETKKGDVYIDYTNIPSIGWKEYPIPIFDKIKFNFRQKPAKICPGSHFFMGGIRVDEKCQTNLAGLFACGEIVWGLHGANRRGGNSLTECIVRGLTAGKAAAEYAKYNSRFKINLSKEFPSSAHDEQSKYISLNKIITQLKNIAWKNAGIIRSEDIIDKGLCQLEKFDKILHQANCRDKNELKLRENLLSTAFTLKAVLTASRGRLESRGSFYREDYPHTDEKKWRKNSCLSYDKSNNFLKLSYHTLDE